MKRILIDINIILDLLNKRKDHEAAASLFDKCTGSSIKGYLCSHEITTLAYFMGKYKYSKEQRNFILNKLFNIFNIIPATKEILKDALYSGISDFEDAVIEVSAISIKIDFIVSRDLKDFKKSRISTYNAREALEFL